MVGNAPQNCALQKRVVSNCVHLFTRYQLRKEFTLKECQLLRGLDRIGDDVSPYAPWWRALYRMHYISKCAIACHWISHLWGICNDRVPPPQRSRHLPHVPSPNNNAPSKCSSSILSTAPIMIHWTSIQDRDHRRITPIFSNNIAVSIRARMIQQGGRSHSLVGVDFSTTTCYPPSHMYRLWRYRRQQDRRPKIWDCGIGKIGRGFALSPLYICQLTDAIICDLSILPSFLFRGRPKTNASLLMSVHHKNTAITQHNNSIYFLR